MCSAVLMRRAKACSFPPTVAPKPGGAGLRARWLEPPSVGPRRRWGLVAAAIALGLSAVLSFSGPVPARGAAPAAPPLRGLPDGVPGAALKPEPALPAPAGWPFPEAFPRTMGFGRLDAGALYWTDFLYDDHGGRGVQTKPPATGLAPPAGSYVYPDGPAANNGADIFRLGVGLDAAAT